MYFASLSLPLFINPCHLNNLTIYCFSDKEMKSHPLNKRKAIFVFAILKMIATFYNFCSIGKVRKADEEGKR